MLTVLLRGRWSFEAAEAILGDDTSHLLENLCRRSLINSEVLAGEVRFHFLESVRDFAAMFVSDDQIYAARVKHNRFFCELVMETVRRQPVDSFQSLQTLDAEHPNIVAAVDFGLRGPAELLEGTS